MRDVDLLGYGDSAPEPMLAVFKEICAINENNGILFDVDALRIDLIREQLEYDGLRLRTTAQLAGARITVVIDIGFGDAIEPGVEEINLPVLLDLPVPRLRAYARETVVAEKFQAMVMLGLANTRMKDFYDIWMLSRNYDFDGERLSRAIAATFERRGTAIPEEVPDALTSTFSTLPGFRRAGEAHARRVFFSGKPMSAAETMRYGLLSEVVPEESSTTRWRRRSTSCSLARRAAVAMIKKLVHYVLRHDYQDNLFYTVDRLADFWETDEAREGMASFFEKRKPAWHRSGGDR
jgi:hypothetical protein